MNGNPVRCLLEDGLPGRQHLPDRPRPLRQHRQDARRRRAPPGSASGRSPTACERGIARRRSTTRSTSFGHVEAIMVDFDIDVIDRAQCPGAPGARPGGMPVDDVLRRRPPARRRAAGPAGRPHRVRPEPRRQRHHRADRGPLGLRGAGGVRGRIPRQERNCVQAEASEVSASADTSSHARIG